MMFRETHGTTIAISQPSHAWLSGQIIRAWGNAEFGPVAPFEDVCLGAEQHDSGWLAWEQAPTLNETTGRPHSFRELNIATHTGIWRQGVEMARVFGRYPALLVSLHGAGLYAAFDARVAKAEDAAIVRDFLDGQMAVRRRLIGDLRADPVLGDFVSPELIERNRGLVRTADRMSIAICTALRDLAVRTDDPLVAIVRDVPTADGLTDLRLRMADDGAAVVSVAPWPFAAAGVRVCCEGTSFGQRFDRVEAMREAVRDGHRVTLSVLLVPGQ